MKAQMLQCKGIEGKKLAVENKAKCFSTSG